jgi:hypothetical protein
MQITFPGADGQTITVADSRREPVLTRPGKDISIALPQERRPMATIIAVMKV